MQKHFELITLYAREEASKDVPGKKNTVIYRDEACTQLYVLWQWFVSGRPVSRKQVTLNCYRWNLEWVTA